MKKFLFIIACFVISYSLYLSCAKSVILSNTMNKINSDTLKLKNANRLLKNKLAKVDTVYIIANISRKDARCIKEQIESQTAKVIVVVE